MLFNFLTFLQQNLILIGLHSHLSIKDHALLCHAGSYLYKHDILEQECKPQEPINL